MTTGIRNEALRTLPAVGEAISHPALAPYLEKYPRNFVIAALREEIEALRRRILAGELEQVDAGAFFAAVQARVEKQGRPNLRRVINATGVVIHTNLGRSPLSAEALSAVIAVAMGYSNLEYDLEAGERGKRSALVDQLICRLTGAEAALVVNNNAAAVLLALNSLADGREVIVSRGELIEIGGSFRIPDVMKRSGAQLVEVGTTNRTHLVDYERAINERTALLLKVHPSNYRILGFTKAVNGPELAELAHKQGRLVMEDLGSGLLLDGAELKMPEEPSVREIIDSGVDLATFSGDKLLGGPQAGIIVGRAGLVQACARNPLHRALRIDKLTLAALEATLRLYFEPALALDRIPTLRMIALSEAELSAKAKRMAAKLRRAVGKNVNIAVIQSAGQVGGGAMPLIDLKGPVIAVDSPDFSADRLAATLRVAPTPIIVRIEEDRVIADPRTILAFDEPDFQDNMVWALKKTVANGEQQNL